MFKSKKSQEALEFMLILIFVFAIISGVMFIVGSLSGDFIIKDKQNIAKNFLENIGKEIDILNSVNGGYSRSLEIYSQDYTIELMDGIIIIKDLYDNNMTYYYDIPIGLNITMNHKVLSNGLNITVLNFFKGPDENHLDLLPIE